MRIHILSDLHAELAPGALPIKGACDTGADLVVIAGDLGRAPDAPALARRMFPATPHLVLVAGNHEHYGTGLTIDGGSAALRAAADAASRPDATMQALEDEAALIPTRTGTIRVLGCTLWTDYALFGSPVDGMAACSGSMADHRLIRGTEGRTVRPEELRRRHARSRRFLAAALRTPWDGPTVVVTHHLPSIRSVSRRWLSDPVSAGFASRLDRLVALGPAVWVHGHSHDTTGWRDDNGTLCVCNPAGYARSGGRRENGSFHGKLVIAIDRTADGSWRARVDT